MHTPQILMIVIMTVGTGISLGKHGEPRTGKYNFWASIVSDVILAGLLYWGGFWKA